MMLYSIKKSKHYKKNHERNVSWDLVLNIIFTTKRRKKGKNLFEFKTKKFYVLAKKEGNILKVINAKKLKK